MSNQSQNETSKVLSDVVNILEELKISYFITGSVASGLRGQFRATNDIDIVIDLDREKIVPFHKKLEHQFFVDEEHIINSVSSGNSFNIIHIETVLKVDFFTKKDELQSTQLERSSSVVIPFSNPIISAKIASDEDVIISKMIWYKKGGYHSERQYRDILGVINVAGSKLDWNYIEKWSKKLELIDLYKKLRVL